MTQTKLQILGPYTPEHEGPFCTRDGNPVRVITRTDGSAEFPVVGLVADDAGPMAWDDVGSFFGKGQRDELDLMNAREVPAAREFWVNEYHDGFGTPKLTEQSAKDTAAHGFIRTIHVREVLPGEGE